jgi:hypothetical protein
MLGSLRIFCDRVMLLVKLGKLWRMRSIRFGDVVRPAFRISDTFKCGTVRPPLLPERQGPQIPLHRYAVTG